VTRSGVAFFIVRRLVVLVVLLIFVSYAIFSLQYIAPGSVIDILLGTNIRTPETVAALTQKYHLDESFFTQYWIWLNDAAHLEFGDSISTTLPVADEMTSRLPTSLFLGLYAFILTMVLGLGFGILSALRKWSLADRGIVATSIVGLSTPAFVSGVFLIYIFAVELRWFPVFGDGDWFLDRLWHLTLPAFALAFVAAAYVLKHTRAAMIGVLDQDYVTFARARGLSSRRVLFMYALRNALIPIVTISGLILAYVITGAVIVEVTFSIQGIGWLLVQSATTKDLPVLQGVGLVVAATIIVANLLADLAYLAVDPRIRLRGGRA
jgi:peptide/nickel transport system permease protein